jgi:hypothetical protein
MPSTRRFIGLGSTLLVLMSAVTLGAVEAGPAVAAVTSWSVVPSPNVSLAQSIDLRGVSCGGPSACTAVGTYTTSDSTQRTLIESWNGSVWSIVPSPNTSPTDSDVLLGVSCSGPAACFAVGNSNPGRFLDRTLIESWNGSSWSIVPSPNVALAPTNFLNSVSCSGPFSCTAVGFSSVDPPRSSQTLIETWNGSVWSIVASPNVPSAFDDTLSGVSCSGPSACFAVGMYNIGASTEQTLIESWNGSVGSIVASPDTSPSQLNALSGVSCSSASACTAVGFSFAVPDRTLIESWDGSVWSIVPSPNTSSTQGDGLSGVSCRGPTACTAVGSSGGNHKTLVESSALSAQGNIFATTFQSCNSLHVGYNRFVNGTIVHWRVTTNGAGTVASGQFSAIGGGKLGSKTHHFIDIPLGTTLPSDASGIQSHVLFTWADGGRFYATRDPGC